MFSDKNYGLPKDLIEAAKRVHEKQLEEGAGKYAEPRIDPKIRDEKNTDAVTGALHDLAGRERKKNIEKLPGAKKSQAKKPQAEEVQFTEEELAEAFAIFLEENFHVDMLTEEDLDYIFEEEFPQWLEEQERLSFFGALKRKLGFDKQKPKPKPNSKPVFPGEDAQIKRAQERATAKAFQSDTGGPGETGVGDKTPPLPTRNPKPTPRNKVSAKPAVSARKQTGGPSLFQQAKKAVRPTPGDSGRTATDRLKYMARRGNKASQRALRGPKKDWRSSVFNPDGN